GKLDPSKGIPFEGAINWWTTIWENYNSDPFFSKYRQDKGHEWADDDLKAILIMLTRRRQPGGSANLSGYTKLRPIAQFHTDSIDKGFETQIVEELRAGRIIIVDLSQ